ncbi:MAG TPA: T9SS type A sorting domain-containing protein [Hanamia sp.]
MKATIIFIYIIIISITSGYGQSQLRQVINVSGGSSKNIGYTLEWSIGELTLINEMDAADSSYILTNGFIQPTGGLVQPPLRPTLLSFKRNELTSANIRIFPNPTQDILQIDFSQNTAEKISVQLSDGLGHIVYTNVISSYGSGLTEKINMKGFTNGIYILYIKKLNPVSGQYDLEAGSYKIIKL